VLEIYNLTKIYPNGIRALNNVSVTIRDGEFVVIVGLSGAGKSTFLRCINRLVEPTSGRILLDGVDITAASPAELRKIRLRIGMIFQQFNLIRRETVLTNVLCGRLGYVNPWMSLLGLWAPEDIRRAMQGLERAGLADRALQRADTRQGGREQRAGIARALMQEPTLMLADEPVASLDPATSHSVMRYLEEINREDGITVVCNLHFLSLARRYATRVLGFRAGEIVFDGHPDEIDRRRFQEIYGEDAVEVEIA